MRGALIYLFKCTDTFAVLSKKVSKLNKDSKSNQMLKIQVTSNLD